MASSYNGGTTAYEVFGTTSPATGSAPSTATDGLPLNGLKGVSVQVASATGTTLSGAGSLLGYVYDDRVALWARCPAIDLTCSTASVRTLAFQAFELITPRNARVKWIPSGVTFSAGTAGVTVYMLGHLEGAVY